MGANMKTMRAENEGTLAKQESAIDRFRLSNEKAIGELRTESVKAIGEIRTESVKAIGGLRTDNKKAVGELRTDIEKSINSITMRVIGVVALGVALMAVFIAYLQFFK